MKKILRLIKYFKNDETGGGLLVMTPFFCLLFIMLTALVLTVALWAQRRQTVQMMADCASRAGTLAIDKQYAVLESDGKYHVYTELDPTKANENAAKVLQAFDTNGFDVQVIDYNPVTTNVAVPREKYAIFDSPEWSSRDHKYYRKVLTKQEQYYNGDFSVYMYANVHGIWEDLLDLSNNHPITVYSQSMCTGDVVSVH